MDPSGVAIISIFLVCVAELIIWLLLCFAVTVVVAVVQLTNKKIRQLNPVRRTIKLAAYATIGLIMLMPLEIVYFTMYWAMQFSVWLLLCLIVTVISAAVQLINKKIRKKKPIHWAIKLAVYAVFYTISLFAIMKLLGSYPGNWLATDKVYRELVYELYNLELDCYEYERIHKGSNGEIVISFEEHSYLSDHILRTTLQQRDYIAIKTAVEEYMELNESFQGNKINLNFRIGGSGGPLCSIYNFDPETGEMGTDVPCWFAEGIYANNCTELAENYHDFSGISGVVRTLDDIQELVNLRNLTYLHLYVGGAVREDKALEEQYLEELNTLLPDCEIQLNQY